MASLYPFSDSNVFGFVAKYTHSKLQFFSLSFELWKSQLHQKIIIIIFWVFLRSFIELLIDFSNDFMELLFENFIKFLKLFLMVLFKFSSIFKIDAYANLKRLLKNVLSPEYNSLTSKN